MTKFLIISKLLSLIGISAFLFSCGKEPQEGRVDGLWRFVSVEERSNWTANRIDRTDQYKNERWLFMLGGNARLIKGLDTFHGTWALIREERNFYDPVGNPKKEVEYALNAEVTNKTEQTVTLSMENVILKGKVIKAKTRKDGKVFYYRMEQMD